MVEMERFEKLGVIKLVPLSELKEQVDKGIAWKWLTIKKVFDWRFRPGQWTRSSKLVAREFKQAGQRNDVFSPATNTSLVRILPALAFQKEMKLDGVDNKDAVLQVPQRRKTACLFPQEVCVSHGW